MSENEKATQQELMKKFLEEKKNNGNSDSPNKFKPNNKLTKSTSKAKRSYNGGGFFDK